MICGEAIRSRMYWPLATVDKVCMRNIDYIITNVRISNIFSRAYILIFHNNNMFKVQQSKVKKFRLRLTFNPDWR